MQIFIKCLDKTYTLDIEKTDTYQDFYINFTIKYLEAIFKHPTFFIWR